MSETVVTLKITEEEKERLRDIAKSMGFTIGRGNEAEWGSIRQLNVAIARGDVAVLNIGKNPVMSAT